MPKAIPTPMVNHRPRKFLEFFSGRPDLGHNLSSTGTKGDFMKAPDLVELAARNLRESVLRNSLTTAGHRSWRRFACGDALPGYRPATIGQPPAGTLRALRHHHGDLATGISRIRTARLRRRSVSCGEPGSRRERAPGNFAPARRARGVARHSIRYRAPLPGQAASHHGGGPPSFGARK